MKRNLLILAACIYAISLSAQSAGINFLHGVTWAEAVTKAKAENKLIFIDFYTQWCGPCMNMAQTVFSLPTVGYYYNHTFVNLKIDAEEGEGMTLAKKYGVHSYPTYAFIDPTTENIVHRSSSRQSAEQFIQTGKAATIPTQRSFYLQEQYAKGNRERAFLIDYIRYNHSIYARNNVQKAFEDLLKNGAKLTEPDIWEVYADNIPGITPYLRQVSNNYMDFCQRFGKKAVDAKLAKETTYADLAAIEALCDYEGKDFNCKMIHINNSINEKKYDDAAARIDAMIADTNVNQQELISRLKFIARLSYKTDEMPDAWFYKCVDYLRYIAYNQKERDDAFIHQEYASALEMVVRRMNDKQVIPAYIIAPPTHGKTVYNMRPDALKAKPRRK
ncbi:thioredoxin family protein [Bacteroides sp. GM023]|uniref:thioredoxin family protein n=1 Tax=Bacteroides sp. GM023 TaxID=2723058 RepID=UPI00168B33A8|nr:thioredoxin family protein [Bacteroides sp. GM023]MBD3592149.1 thioredoxin fold domain-containing protein [Bacteroides sp. GM023]